MAWDGVDRRNNELDNTRDLVVETHTRLNALCDFLMDNGQPGAISQLRNEVSAIDERVQTLEGWKKWVNGVAAAVGAILGVVATFWRYIIVVKVGKEGG